MNQTGLNKLKNKFKVHFEDETNPSLNPFCIMTIHDLGYDHTYFDNLKKKKAFKSIFLHFFKLQQI